VLLPRPEGRGDDLTDLLEIAGYEVVRAPFVALEPAPAEDIAPALDRLGSGAFDLLVVTSPATVRALLAVDPDLQVPASTRIVAVGGGTTRALHEAGFPVDLVAEGSGAALVEAVRRHRPAARDTAARVLLPASSAAAPTVREGLERLGMEVEQVDAYHPSSAPLPPRITSDLAGGEIDAIVLTSSMIARRAAAIGVHPRTAVVVIGRPTQEAAEAAGLRVDARAEHPDAPSLARAVHLALARPADAHASAPADPLETGESPQTPVTTEIPETTGTPAPDSDPKERTR
jgi:uroporphyrinogen-III synthase